MTGRLHKRRGGRRTVHRRGRAGPQRACRRWGGRMGRARQQLPPELPEHGFTLATARAEGVTGRVRTGFDTPSRGLRVRQGEGGPPSVVEMAGLVLEILPPDAVLGHDTAARLHELPAPRPWRRDEPVHVVRPSGAPPFERRGVVSHSGLESRAVTRAHGLPVVSALHTWSDLAASWPRRRVFAAGDALLRHHGVARDEAVAHVGTLAGRRGVRVLRELAPRLDGGAASPKESEVRLLFLDHGLPEAQLNVEVRDDSGMLIGIPDFVWMEQRVVAEYDGDQHRTDRSVWQYERDRRANFEANGWTYVEMTNIHLTKAAYTVRLVSRMRRLLLCRRDLAGGRAPRGIAAPRPVSALL